MRCVKNIFLFCTGGLAYILIECIWRCIMDRPPVHWSMFVVGGIAFLIIGSINEHFSWDMPIWIQTIIGTILVVAIEFVAGCILNLWLGLNVWDYSTQPFNLLGQVCLTFTGAWIVLVTIAIVLDDWLRYAIFKEEKPRYQLWFSA